MPPPPLLGTNATVLFHRGTMLPQSPSTHSGLSLVATVACLTATFLVLIALCITYEWYRKKSNRRRNSCSGSKERSLLKRYKGTTSLRLSSSSVAAAVHQSTGTRLQVSTRYHTSESSLQVTLWTLVVSKVAMPKQIPCKIFIEVQLLKKDDDGGPPPATFQSLEKMCDSEISFREDFHFAALLWDELMKSTLKFSVLYAHRSERGVIGHATLSLKSHLAQLQYRRGRSVWLGVMEKDPKENRRALANLLRLPLYASSGPRGYIDVSVEYFGGTVRVVVHGLRELPPIAYNQHVAVMAQLIQGNRTVSTKNFKVAKPASTTKIVVQKQHSYDVKKGETFSLLFEINMRRRSVFGRQTRIGRVVLGNESRMESEKEHWASIREGGGKIRMEHELHI